MHTLRISQPKIGFAERAAANRVLRSGSFAQGPEVQAFEDEFASLIGAGYAVAVNSGTSALHLGLLAAGIGPGDEVILPSFSFAATANAVALTGAEPVFADVSLDDYCLDPGSALSMITHRTAGIVLVDLYGAPARLREFRKICEPRGIGLFEDAAQAHLASTADGMVGTLGSFGAFSFYPTKNMTTIEGGMVTTQDQDLARRVRLLRNQGMETRYQNEVVGFNNRMSDVSAAIGRVQLKKLPRWTSLRINNAKALSEGLGSVLLPTVRAGEKHVFHQFTIRVEEGRERLAEWLMTSRKIETGIYYPVPIHRLPPFQETQIREALPNTETLSSQVLSLPVHHRLSRQDLKRIVKSVNDWQGAPC